MLSKSADCSTHIDNVVPSRLISAGSFSKIEPRHGGQASIPGLPQDGLRSGGGRCTTQGYRACQSRGSPPDWTTVGLISAYYAKWVDDPIWKDDPAIRGYFAWARKYYDGNQEDGIAVYGYQVAQVLEYVLRRRGD
jgi:hypothetical protein